MGGAYSAYGGGERRVQGFGGRNRRERDQWRDPGVDGRIILRWISSGSGMWGYGLDRAGSG